MSANKQLSLILVPFGLGAGRPGAEEGPESMIQADLIRQIRKTDYELAGESRVKCPPPSAARSSDGPAKHMPEVIEMSRQVAKQVSQAVLSRTMPLVLGGDHSVTIGVLAGLTTQFANLGVIYFDAHAGLNTELTSPTGHYNEMSLAAALGKTCLKLSDVAHNGTPIKKNNVVIIGVRDVEPAEKELIRSEGITCFTMHDIDRLGIQKVIEKAMQIAGNGTDGIHVSFDADCLDPLEAPGVGMPVAGGLTYREAHFACELLAESGRITSIDVVEVNSLQDASRRTARLAVGLIASLLGKRIL
ncbi:arginase [Gordoniibacillus kamchatkensis]|uniref:Arginase n=1 Tax=Gordoniibacillus kamchatkensis TaxID=1590651 RepID=A0ABR5ADB5_9BACL|nr:arginase [Paenibacillus sp. VKM B-2647]KIL39028.1 arginase [Paenibacillus sp. VKM B-2647]